MSDCLLVPVRRDRNYDTIVWDGDCSRLKANYAGFAEERTCVCRKKLRVNRIESELTGTLYQATGKSPSCLYDYREIGNVKFLSAGSIWRSVKKFSHDLTVHKTKEDRDILILLEDMNLIYPNDPGLNTQMERWSLRFYFIILRTSNFG